MIMVVSKSLIDTCKIILKHKIKEYQKGTHQYAEVLDLGKAVHLLEKIDRYQKLHQQGILNLLAEAEQKGVITKDTKWYLLRGMVKVMESVNLQVENEFVKTK